MILTTRCPPSCGCGFAHWRFGCYLTDEATGEVVYDGGIIPTGMPKDCDRCGRGWRNGGGCPLPWPTKECDFWPPEDDGLTEWGSTVRTAKEGCRR